MELYE